MTGAEANSNTTGRMPAPHGVRSTMGHDRRPRVRWRRRPAWLSIWSSRYREPGELDFGDRLQTFRRHADAHAGDQILGERRVDHALGAELVEQAQRRAEHAAVAPDVLAEHHHIAVVGHRAVQREIDGLDERYLRQRHFPDESRRAARNRPLAASHTSDRTSAPAAGGGVSIYACAAACTCSLHCFSNVSSRALSHAPASRGNCAGAGSARASRRRRLVRADGNARRRRLSCDRRADR